MGALLAVLLVGAPAAAFSQANCRNTGAFGVARHFQKEAAAQAFPKPRSRRGAYLVPTSASSISIAGSGSSQNFLEISDKML